MALGRQAEVGVSGRWAPLSRNGSRELKTYITTYCIFTAGSSHSLKLYPCSSHHAGIHPQESLKMMESLLFTSYLY